MRLLALLLACLAAAPAASAHGGLDHGERLVDGRLVEVPESAPAEAGTERSRATRGWRGTGPRDVAIVQVLMPGRDTAQYPARSESAMRTAFAGTSGALQEMTDGVVSLREGGPVLTITAATSGGCNWRGWGDQALAALRSSGVDADRYLADGHIAYVLTGPTGCGWGGLAYLPGNELWLDNTLSRRIAVHELGHNFGLDHAASRRCTSGSTGVLTSGSCSVTEYGDPFDPMGQADRHFSAAHKRQGGWLPSDRVQSVTANGTFTLGAASDTGAATRLLSIPRPDGTRLTVELRRPFGVDAFGAGDPVVTGVSLRLWRSSAIDLTHLLDARPETTTFADAALPAGRTVTDAVAGISVTLNALAGGAATVSVDLRGLGPDVSAPDAPVVSATGSAHGTVALTWPAAADDVQTMGYRVLRDGVRVAELGAAARGWTDVGLSSGETHDYAVEAYDAAGNARASSTVPGTVPVSEGGTPPAEQDDPPAPIVPQPDPQPDAQPPAPAAPVVVPPSAPATTTPTTTTTTTTTTVSRKRKARYVRRCKRVRRGGRVRKVCWRVKVRPRPRPARTSG